MVETVRNQEFFDARIDITGEDIEACRFDGCVIHCEPGAPTRFVGNILNDCQQTGDGWPPVVLVVETKPR